MAPDPGSSSSSSSGGETTDVKPGEKLSVDPSGQRITRVRLSLKKEVTRLKCAKIRFHTDSAIFLPAGLPVLKAVYLQAEQNANQRVLIASHTDTQGSAESNEDLSRARSENVRCVLLGKAAEWVTANERDNSHLAEDVRRILRWAAQSWAWPCDPGAVSNDPIDDAVEQAIRAFKVGFNQQFTRQHVSEDVATEEDEGFWKRVLNLYGHVLAESLGLQSPSELGAKAGKLQWVDPEHPAIGCGERFPLVDSGDGKAEAENRRTEFLFIDVPMIPLDNGEGAPTYLEKVYQGKYTFKDLDCPKPEFFGQEIPDGNVVFVIDCSGSMSPADRNGAANRADRIGRAKRALNLAIDALDEETRFTVVGYSNGLFLSNRTAEGKPRLVAATREDKDRVMGWVSNLRAGGGTQTGLAMQAAFEAADLGGGPKTIKLLSDGFPTPRAGENVTSERARIQREVGGSSSGWQVDTVGFFDDATAPGALGDFMRSLAEDNGGTYTEVVIPLPAGASRAR